MPLEATEMDYSTQMLSGDDLPIIIIINIAPEMINNSNMFFSNKIQLIPSYDFNRLLCIMPNVEYCNKRIFFLKKVSTKWKQRRKQFCILCEQWPFPNEFISSMETNFVGIYFSSDSDRKKEETKKT